MLEKTQKFLKKEIGKRAEHCTAFWREKAEISWVIFTEFYAHLSAVTYPQDGKTSREKLQEHRSEF